MGKIYEGLKRVLEKITAEPTGTVVYQNLLNSFATLVTYDNAYLGARRRENVIIKLNGSGPDLFIDCGGFGIIVTPKDVIVLFGL